MSKLSKRQIIIFLIMGLVVLYGAYEYLIAAPARKSATITKNDPAEIKTFVSGLTSDLMKDSLTGVDAYIIGRAETDWKRNPFIEKNYYKEWAAREGAGASGASAKIIYSGYVDSGKKKLAVINGFEYAVGESLEIPGYVLKNITSLKVVISNRNTGSELEIPIQE
jgi:hypothetical protein